MKFKELFNHTEQHRIESWRQRMLEAKTPFGLYLNKWRIDRLMKKVANEYKQGLR